MISKRALRDRMKRSADESFSTPSSTLMERLPEMAEASPGVSSPALVRVGRRIAGTLASIGLIGWLTMGGAGALLTVAAVGNLPDPVQQFVADVVHVVGIELPNPAQEKIEKQQNPANNSTNESGTQGGTPSGGSSGTHASPADAGSNGGGSSGGAATQSTTSTTASSPTTTSRSSTTTQKPPKTTTTKPPTTTTTRREESEEQDDSRQTNSSGSSSTHDSSSRSDRDE